MFKLINRVLFGIVNPSYWIQNNPYNSEVDDVINNLNWDNITLINDYYADVDGMKLWICNHPYNSFHIGRELPSRLTRYKLMKRINPLIIEAVKEKRKKNIESMYG